MSDLIGNPNCWFSHAQVHIIYFVLISKGAEMYNFMLTGLDVHEERLAYQDGVF